MLSLAEKIGLDPTVISRLSSLTEKEKRKAEHLTAKCLEGDFSCLRKESCIIRLAVILKCALKAREEYRERGIPDSIFLDTMSDIKIWCENADNKGIKNYGWLKNHLRLELFRLGRLQFQLYECKNRTLNYKRLPFPYGERLIYVHIPQGEKLGRERCIESFSMAEEFFERYFPEYKYKWYFCESWLLYDENKEFMAEDSNILSFAALFDHRYSMRVDVQTIERVFGKRRLLKSRYPEETSLQRSLKAYMLSGGKAGVGIGVIDRNIFLTTESK